MSLSSIVSIGKNEANFNSHEEPSETDVVKKAHVVEDLDEISHIQGRKNFLKTVGS